MIEDASGALGDTNASAFRGGLSTSMPQSGDVLPANPEARVKRPGGALFAVGLAGFCAFLGFYATQPLLPMFTRVFAVSPAEAALTVSAPMIGVTLASPFSGLLSRRFGHHSTIVASLLVLPVPAFLAATASNIPALVVWRFVQGLVVPGVYAVTMTFLAEEWPPDGLGRAMAALVTGNVIGGFSGRFVSGIAAERGGWRTAFIVIGIILAVAAVTAVRLLPRSERTRVASGAMGGLRARSRDVLGEPSLLATFAIGFMVLFSLVATFTYVTFYLSGAPFNLGTGALSWLFCVYLVGAVVTPIAGHWIDRVGSRRAITWALAAAIAGGAVTLAHSIALVIVGLTMISTAVFVSQAAAMTYLRTAAPPRARSGASGLYVSIYYMGAAVGGLAPAVAWSIGGWPACVLLVGCVQLGAVSLARRYWRAATA